MKPCSSFWITLGAFPIFSSLVEAKDVHIAVGMSMPPYFIEEKSEGLELEIIKESLSRVGHNAVFKFVPLSRVPWVYARSRESEIDAIATTDEQLKVEAFFSVVYITYQNVAISLAKSKFNIQTPSDLEKYNIVAFQNSTIYLGEEYRRATQKSRSYREVFEQEKQVKLLFYGTTDVVVSDKNIFDYYVAKNGNLDEREPLAYHHIFPENPYKMAFKVAALRDDFNKGFLELKKSGAYEAIVNKWAHKKSQTAKP